MANYSKQIIGRQAKELGFIRDTLEKVLRLVEILQFFEDDSLLAESLALKGGTAINLTIFDLPRLSVDIDLDYCRETSREGMFEDRELINERIKRYMTSTGYHLSEKSKNYHSLDSMVYSYINCGGMNDNIKIEINYSLRHHILPLVNREIVNNGFFPKAIVRSVAAMEIFGSKIVALLSRTAARDLYDINNMIAYGLFNNTD